MSAHEPTLPDLPADFEQRCSTMYARLEAGEVMTVQYLADQLGLPFEFLAASLSIYSAAIYGVPLAIDTGRPTTH